MAVEEGGTEEKEGGGEEIPPQGEGGQERKKIDCKKEEEEGGGQESKEPEGEKEEGEGEGEKEGAEVGRDGVEAMEEESTEPVTETGNHVDFKISSIIIGQVHNSCNVLTFLHITCIQVLLSSQLSRRTLKILKLQVTTAEMLYHLMVKMILLPVREKGKREQWRRGRGVKVGRRRRGNRERKRE